MWVGRGGFGRRCGPPTAAEAAPTQRHREHAIALAWAGAGWKPALQFTLVRHMPRTRVKICSICSPQDADLAVLAGADALGLILHPASPRYVGPELARQILARVPPFVISVGVFVDSPLDSLAQTARELGLACIQLSGSEDPAYAAQLAELGLRFIKSLKADDTLRSALSVWRLAAESLGPAFAGIVLDSPSPAPGGTGQPNNWPAVRRLQDENAFAGLPPLIAAGGLTPQTVHDVIRLVHPFAVDVSSGVEAQLRSKSPEKLADFIAQTRRADRG